jgi:glycosyltransferase involved in cell wall biosynthesis
VTAVNQNRKSVLIITYYWPPSGGAGVQRWLKTVKYLREYGWEPIIYTPENPEAPATDNSLLKDIPEGVKVLKQPIWEPYSFYKKFLGLKKDEKINAGFLTEKKKPGLAEKIAVWIRGNFFIPDARKYWVKPSIEFLSNYLRSHPIDAVVSTGPPHSMHLIALSLKKKTGIPWLADFRDPWTNIDFYDKLMLSKVADYMHRKLEKSVLKNADIVTSIGKQMADEFVQLGAKKVEIISNGFDEDDFTTEKIILDTSFSISHIGSINKDRNNDTFWKALKELMDETPALRAKLRIKLVGKCDHAVLESIDKYGLETHLEKTEYLPHDQVLKKSMSTQVLLLLLNNTPNAKGIMTGKFYEYLAARRPIICIGPEDGEAAKTLEETAAGKVAGFEDKQKMKAILKEYFEKYQQNNLKVESSAIENYSRRKLTGRFAELLDGISGH